MLNVSKAWTSIYNLKLVVWKICCGDYCFHVWLCFELVLLRCSETKVILVFLSANISAKIIKFFFGIASHASITHDFAWNQLSSFFHPAPPDVACAIPFESDQQSDYTLTCRPHKSVSPSLALCLWLRESPWPLLGYTHSQAPKACYNPPLESWQSNLCICWTCAGEC